MGGINFEQVRLQAIDSGSMLKILDNCEMKSMTTYSKRYDHNPDFSRASRPYYDQVLIPSHQLIGSFKFRPPSTASLIRPTERCCHMFELAEDATLTAPVSGIGRHWRW
jgi:hypothetical protein